MQTTPATDFRDSTVGDLMTRRVSTLHVDDTVAHAHQVMLWSQFRHLPVVNDAGDLVGVVSDRDLLRFAAGSTPPSAPVADIMTSPVVTAEPTMSVTEASGRMAARKIDCLPVVADGRLVGILTSSDVLAERGKLVHRSGPRHLPIVADVMKRRAASLGAGAPLCDAVAVMAAEEIRHLPVVDAAGRVIGMLSDRDVRTKVGDPKVALLRMNPELMDTLVEDVMTPRPVLVRPSSSVVEVADLLLDERIGAVPVADTRDRLLGIVSYVDVIAYLVGRR
jgi:CBS domain-containing protein